MTQNQNSEKEPSRSSGQSTPPGETSLKTIGAVLKGLPAISQQMKSSQDEKDSGNTTEWGREALRFFSGIVPAEYRRARLNDFKDSINAEDIDYDSYGFCFRGPTGTGKTHLASAIAAEHLRPDHRHTIARERDLGGSTRIYYDPKDMVWVSTPSLMVRLRSTFNGSGETEYQILQELTRAKVLILDDLGAEKQSDFSAATLYAIISERRNMRRVTIVTTNATLGDIHNWEPRIASRLSEFASIRLPDKDRRVGKK